MNCKDHLTSFGMRPKDLDEYLGSFMWIRYCKQRKLDMLLHLLRSIGDVCPPTKSILPALPMTSKYYENALERPYAFTTTMPIN